MDVYSNIGKRKSDSSAESAGKMNEPYVMLLYFAAHFNMHQERNNMSLRPNRYQLFFYFLTSLYWEKVSVYD